MHHGVRVDRRAFGRRAALSGALGPEAGSMRGPGGIRRVLVELGFQLVDALLQGQDQRLGSTRGRGLDV
jgi:hypothetical protein